MTVRPAPTLQTCRVSPSPVGAREEWGSRLGVGSPFPKPEGLLPFSKDVGFREGVVPLYSLEGLEEGNTQGAEELGADSRLPRVGETEGSQARARTQGPKG